MKKEIVAAAVLIIIPVAAFFNVRFIDKTTEDLICGIDDAEKLMEAGDEAGSEDAVASSLQKWQSKDRYAHMLLRHDEVEGVTEAYFVLLAGIQSGKATPALFDALKESLTGLADIEKPSIQSIF